ncbi:MAG: hypothetical protein KatS3mg119_2425 [Rhodothalassiaceae bacterium]|nr:MAG: hypothetical protein KatS3mg119_2425 [Rhodothalassiaceae bacterium]
MPKVNWPRLLLAALVLYVVFFALYTVTDTMVIARLGEGMKTVMRPGLEGSVFGIYQMIAYAVMTVIFALIFTYGREGRGPGEGARYGLLMGLLLGAVDFVWTIGLPLDPVLAFLAFARDIVIFVIAGAVLAFLYRPASAAGAADAGGAA